MSIKPILFNGDMVRAILDGRKTVTRRVVKPQPELVYVNGEQRDIVNRDQIAFKVMDKGGKDCYTFPPYQLGDILYVRETWCYGSDTTQILFEPEPRAYDIQNKADYPHIDKDLIRWRPSIHMPKEAARIWLKVTNVRVERLQDITTDQIEAEGIKTEHPYRPLNGEEKLYAFSQLWASTVKEEDINRYGWQANPFVWVIEFERCEKPQEENNNG